MVVAPAPSAGGGGGGGGEEDGEESGLEAKVIQLVGGGVSRERAALEKNGGDRELKRLENTPCATQA